MNLRVGAASLLATTLLGANPAWADTDATDPCDTTPLATRFAVSRTWPVEGGTHPADRPMLVELTAPAVAPVSPDQPVEVVLPKTFQLTGGKVFGVSTVRSDYGTTRYLPGPWTDWAPSEWDDDRPRAMLVQLQVFEGGPNGETLPGQLTVGDTYTLSMLVGDPASPDGYSTWELHFTAGEPAGEPQAPVSGAYHAVVADSSCQEVHLDCSTTPNCDVTCAQVGTLQKVRHTVTVDGDNVPLPEDEPWVLEHKLSDYGFTFRQVRFPDDPPGEVGAQIDVFQSASTEGLTACASLSIGVPGGPKVDSEVSCDTAEGIPDLCQGGGGGGEDAGSTADAGPAADAGAVQDAGPVGDTGGSGGTGGDVGGGGGTGGDAGGSGGGADAGGTSPSDANGGAYGDSNLDGSGIFGTPVTGISVSDGGCGCDLGTPRRRGAAEGWLALLAAAAVWLGLRRASRA